MLPHFYFNKKLFINFSLLLFKTHNIFPSTEIKYFTFYKNYTFSSNNSTKKKLSRNYFHFFDYFLKNFFQLKIKNNLIIYINDLNISTLDQNRYFNWLINVLKRNHIAQLSNLYSIRNMIEIFLIFFYKKDVLFLSNWLKTVLEKIYYKNHKKFLLLFKTILTFMFKYLNNFFFIRGIFFKLKGKIGLGGNSKKKKFKVYAVNKKISMKRIRKQCT